MGVDALPEDEELDETGVGVVGGRGSAGTEQYTSSFIQKSGSTSPGL